MLVTNCLLRKPKTLKQYNITSFIFYPPIIKLEFHL